METVKQSRAGRPPKSRLFIVEERAKIVLERVAMGFQRADVAAMVNMHPSYVTRLLEERADEYAAVAARLAAQAAVIKKK